ncbi:hypothetical protein CCACVL1_02610 [Corchorus capsularis]|uniref:Pentacotripeptide-repeat region of PRORP domain-containing protein n=1 Tax=Corchorus capsularis TaxID=210143 RepID=A0A1R3K7L2_COCAP|nr:hypothetical protein CCACVL1_02610 [Corchorus capsularis]
MRRVRIPLLSIADTLYKSKYLGHGRRNVTVKLDQYRTVATINGHVYLGHRVWTRANSLQAQIVDALRLGDRSRASSLLLDLDDGNQSLKAEDFVYILKYCAISPDPLFVMETWRLMEEKEISLNYQCYFLMIQALCRGGYLEEACNLIKFLGENHGMHPRMSIFNYFLGACAKMQSVNHANQCLDLMERRRAGKNEITYLELLKFAHYVYNNVRLSALSSSKFSFVIHVFTLAVSQQNISAVHEIWKDYIKNYSLNIFSLQRFIRSFSRLKDLKSAYETLQHMVGLAISGKFFVSNTAEVRPYFPRLDIPIPSRVESGSLKVEMGENEHSLALKFDTDASDIGKCEFVSTTTGTLNGYISTPVMKVLRFSFSDVIEACAKAQDHELAEQLMVQMQTLGLQPSNYTYNCFVRACIIARGFSHGMEMLKKMEERNLKPLNATLAALSVQCSEALELDLAEALLDQACGCRYPYPYNAFLKACAAMVTEPHIPIVVPFLI